MCFFCDFSSFLTKKVSFLVVFCHISISDGVITQLMLSINIRTWIYNKFGQSFELLSRVVTMETTIFALILISLTQKHRSKMNANYKLLGLQPHFRILQLKYSILRQNYNKNGGEIEIWGRNMKIVENINFRLIWQFQEVIGQKLHSREKYCHWLFWSKYGSQHIDILLLQFSENFQKNNTG